MKIKYLRVTIKPGEWNEFNLLRFEFIPKQDRLEELNQLLEKINKYWNE